MKPWTVYKNMNIQKKLILYFLITAFIPLNLLGMLSFNKSSRIADKQIGSYGDYAVKQLKQSLDSNLSSMTNISSDVVAFLLTQTRPWYSEPMTYETATEQKNLTAFLTSHESEGLLGLYVITGQGKFVGADQYELVYNRLRKTGWWSRIPKGRSGMFWIGFHKTEYYNLATNHEAVSLVESVPYTISSVPAGTRVLIEEKEDAFMNLIHAFERDTDSYVTITDRGGRILYQTSADFHPRKSDVQWNERLTVNGWRIKARMPSRIFYKSSYAIRTNTMIVGMVSLIVSLFLAGWFASTLTRPLKRLIQSMRQLRDGHLDTRIHVDSTDEFGRLSFQFNEMSARISDLIKENSTLAVKKKETELKMLHYQINPHLMFNTLNSIQWKAKLSGAKDISEMILHLTKVLENNLNTSDELITLEEELGTIKHYLMIQRYRFGDAFQYETCIEDGMKSCLIPRMTLQPLFENIFYHAFSDGVGKIRLIVKPENDGILLELTDDGTGMPADKFPDAMAPVYPGKGRGGLGLSNVKEKFELEFGTRFKMHIQSVPDSGTTVHLRWPLIKEE